jgi:hypothetical protein
MIIDCYGGVPLKVEVLGEVHPKRMESIIMIGVS